MYSAEYKSPRPVLFTSLHCFCKLHCAIHMGIGMFFLPVASQSTFPLPTVGKQAFSSASTQMQPGGMP